MKILVNLIDGKATPAGHTAYIQVLDITEGYVMRLSNTIAKAYGARYNARLDAVTVTGCGYNTRDAIVTQVSMLYPEATIITA